MKERLGAHQTDEELSNFILNYGTRSNCAASSQNREKEEEDVPGQLLPLATNQTTMTRAAMTRRVFLRQTLRMKRGTTMVMTMLVHPTRAIQCAATEPNKHGP